MPRHRPDTAGMGDAAGVRALVRRSALPRPFRAPDLTADAEVVFDSPGSDPLGGAESAGIPFGHLFVRMLKIRDVQTKPMETQFPKGNHQMKALFQGSWAIGRVACANIY